MKLNILNTVSKVPEQTERKLLGAGLYFVRNDKQTGLYIVTPFSNNVHKIFDTLDYKTKKETDEALGEKANQTQVTDIAKSVDVLNVTKADNSRVDALANGIIKQPAVDTYNKGVNSLASVYGLTASNNGSNGKPKQNGWDVLVRNDETKGGTAEKPVSNRYNWNGADWIDMETGNYPEEVALKDELRPKANTFRLGNSVVYIDSLIETGKNLFNPNDKYFADGYILNKETGEATDKNDNYITTGYIRCELGDKIFHSYTDAIADANIRRIAFFDDSLNVLIVLDNQKNGVENNVNATLFRISVPKADSQKNYQIEIGGVTSYELYKEKLKENIETDYQLKDGEVKTSKIENKGVTPVKTTFIKQTKNLYDPDGAKQGSFINASGNLQANPSYLISNPIPIQEGGKIITADFISTNASVCSVQLDDKANVIPASIKPMKEQPIIGVKGAVSAILSFNTTDVNKKIQIEEGNRATEYVQPFKLDENFLPQSSLNDICVPKNLYLLSDTQHDFFYQSIMKRKDSSMAMTVSGSQAVARKMQDVMSITKAKEAVNGIRFDMYETDNYSLFKRVFCDIKVGEKGKDTGKVTATIIGDSYTAGDFYKHALLDNDFVPNLSLVGLRKITDTTNQYNEGRGGWKLSNYFEHRVGATDSYNPFLQPSNAKYWGHSAFWINAWKSFNGTAPSNTLEPNYSCGRYDRCLPKYDENTGFLVNPVNGDVMYDNTKSNYVQYNGTAWVNIDYSSFEWAFDYSKYLLMWELEAPQFFFMLLGLNDFREIELDKVNYDAWLDMATKVHDSYITAVPNGKFTICIPCSSCGTDNNERGDLNSKFNTAMWHFRKWLINTFDNRESESYYLLDTGICIDNVYGYNLSNNVLHTKPFDGYVGDDSIRVQTGNPHPYLSYTQIGLPLAAFIQKYR